MRPFPGAASDEACRALAHVYGDPWRYSWRVCWLASVLVAAVESAREECPCPVLGADDCKACRSVERAETRLLGALVVIGAL